MNKKLISMIGAGALALCTVIGGVMFSDMKTVASGTQITLSVESPTVEKDEEIKVLVNASSGEAMSYIHASVSYDAEKLELVETSSDQASGTNGEVFIYETLAYGEYERSYELTFKALEVGNADIRVKEGQIELYESLELIDVTTSSLPIEVMMSTTASDDARIKDMVVAGVPDMDEIFDPDVYEYDLEVGVSMEMFIYSATPMNRDSVIVAPEDLMLDVGDNYFEVHVTAPAGNEQVYVFNVTRLDHELETETETETEIETETIPETEIESVEETVLETETVNGTVLETETVPETVADEIVVPTPVVPEENETSGTELLDAQAIQVVE